jgi:DNA invertase Pin-like site-specific DNA recombinase
MLDALEPKPPFQVLLVTEPSRIGRDAIRTLGVVQTLEEAGVAVWSTSKRKQIEHKDIGAIVESWSDESERTRVIERVNRARRARFEAVLVTGGRVFGYTNVPVPGIDKAVLRVVNPTQAAVVIRIFEMTAAATGWRACPRS